MSSNRKWHKAFEYACQNPGVTGAELSRLFHIPARTARRYAGQFEDESEKSFEIEEFNFPVETNDAVVYDIETTDFGTEGYAGKLLCCSFLPLSSNKVETLSLAFEDSGSDRRLLKEVACYLAQFRYRIGHNIAAYDENWLNSRLMHYGLEPLDVGLYFDTYQSAKTLAVKTQKSLGNLIDYFNLDGVKTTIYRTSWSNSMSQQKQEFDQALKEIIYRCEEDVKANRKLYNILHWYAIKGGRTIPWKVSRFRGNYWFYR